MKKIFTINTECINCCACQSVCKTGALREGMAQQELNAELCVGCGQCAKICPAGAIQEAGVNA